MALMSRSTQKSTSRPWKESTTHVGELGGHLAPAGRCAPSTVNRPCLFLLISTATTTSSNSRCCPADDVEVTVGHRVERPGQTALRTVGSSGSAAGTVPKAARTRQYLRSDGSIRPRTTGRPRPATSGLRADVSTTTTAPLAPAIAGRGRRRTPRPRGRPRFVRRIQEDQVERLPAGRLRKLCTRVLAPHGRQAHRRDVRPRSPGPAARSVSTRPPSPAPRDMASSPSAPEPANRSRTAEPRPVAPPCPATRTPLPGPGPRSAGSGHPARSSRRPLATAGHDARHVFSTKSAAARPPTRLTRARSARVAEQVGIGSHHLTGVFAGLLDDVLVANDPQTRKLVMRPDCAVPSTSPSRAVRGRVREFEPVRGGGHRSTGRRLRVAGEQQAQARQITAAHPAAQLVQLGDPEATPRRARPSRWPSGTSTPTSITLVATSTSSASGVSLGDAKRRMTSDFSWPRTSARAMWRCGPPTAGRRRAPRRCDDRAGAATVVVERRRSSGSRSSTTSSAWSPIREHTTNALCPCCHLLADALPRAVGELGAVHLVDRERGDSCPPGGDLVQGGDVEVTEYRHRHGSRDRGRRHDQQMRPVPRRPLTSSAARCSTPNRCCSSTTTRPKSANCDRVVEQRVGAHHDPAAPVRIARAASRAGRRPTGGPGQQRDLRCRHRGAEQRVRAMGEVAEQRA